MVQKQKRKKEENKIAFTETGFHIYIQTEKLHKDPLLCISLFLANAINQ